MREKEIGEKEHQQIKFLVKKEDAIQMKRMLE